MTAAETFGERDFGEYPVVELRVIPNDPRFLAGSDGHVYSTRRGAPHRMAEWPTRDGYLRIAYNPVDRERRIVSQAVAPWIAAAFHGPRPDRLQVRHLDGNSTNNCPENLAYGTPKQNAEDRDRHGTTARGLRIGSARFTDEQVRWAVTEVRSGRMTSQDAANELGTHRTVVNGWISGRSRRDATKAVAT